MTDKNTPAPPHQTSTPPASLGWLGHLGAFFSNNAWLSLFTLLLLLGLVGGLWHFTDRLQPPATGKAPLSRSLGAVPSTAPCGQVLAIFRPEATLRQISGLLQSVDAVLVYGPDENGAFELKVPARLARATAQALEKSPITHVASARQECF